MYRYLRSYTYNISDISHTPLLIPVRHRPWHTFRRGTEVFNTSGGSTMTGGRGTSEKNKSLAQCQQQTYIEMAYNIEINMD